MLQQLTKKVTGDVLQAPDGLRVHKISSSFYHSPFGIASLSRHWTEILTMEWEILFHRNSKIFAHTHWRNIKLHSWKSVHCSTLKTALLPNLKMSKLAGFNNKKYGRMKQVELFFADLVLNPWFTSLGPPHHHFFQCRLFSVSRRASTKESPSTPWTRRSNKALWLLSYQNQIRG